MTIRNSQVFHLSHFPLKPPPFLQHEWKPHPRNRSGSQYYVCLVTVGAANLEVSLAELPVPLGGPAITPYPAPWSSAFTQWLPPSCDMWLFQTPKVSTTLNTSSLECKEILQSDTAAHSGDWQKQREQRGKGEKMLMRKEKQSKKLKRTD